MATYLTTKELQELIKVDRSTIYRMAEGGRLPAVKVGRQWRFPQEQVEEWLRERGTPAPIDAEPGEPELRIGDLRAVLPLEAIQALADLLGEMLGAMVVVTNMDGEPLTEVANPCGLFEALEATPGVLPACIEAWRHYGSEIDLEPRFQPSHFGFLCARGFIRVGSELKGMVIAGGFAPEQWPPPPEEIRRIAELTGASAEQFREHIDQVYYADRTQLDWVLALLPRIGSLISLLAGSRSLLVDKLSAIAELAGALAPQRRTP